MYSEILKHRVKELRQIKGYKQYYIAEILGVSQGTYNNWETGKRIPSLDTIIKIADIYDIELDYLFGRNVEANKKLKEK